VLPETPRLKSVLTRLRDRHLPVENLRDLSDQLSCFLLENAANYLPFQEKLVQTPTGHTYQGKECNVPVCGVTIVRAGSSLEKGFKAVFPNRPLGKLLIQTDSSIGEPQLHYCKLPPKIHEKWVFLLDAQVSTGAAGLMAIRVLLDHNILENQIIFCTFTSSFQGLQLIHTLFPKVQIVTCQIETLLDVHFRMAKGLGCFGDRYFGT
jgi:uridine kinase